MSPRAGLDIKKILQEATEIIDTDGVNSLTLATLAKKLKIRPPSLYNHVEGLHGLQKSLAIYGLERLYEVMADSAIGLTKDDAVHALSKAYINFARLHPGLYEATLLLPVDLKDPEVHQVGQKIVDLVVRLLSSYGLDEEASIHAVRGLRSILHGFASLEQKNGFGLPLDIDTSIHLLIETFLAGIHKMEKTPRRK